MKKTKEQKQAEQLDKQIEQLYYKLAVGRQIDILDIGKLFKDASQAITSGMDPTEAVKASIEKFCVKA